MQRFITSPPSFPHSPEQAAIYAAIGSGLSVASKSCAGSGKTYTADTCCYSYDGPVELIPFARSLMNEQSEKFRNYSHINVVNAHSRGKRSILGRVTVDGHKLRDIARKLFDGGENVLAGKLAAIVGKMKTEAYGVWEDAMTIHEIAAKYNFRLSEKEEDTLSDMGETMESICESILSLSDSDSKTIDYDDMIRIPTLNGVRPLSKDSLIVLDEVQDFSPLMYCFVRELVPAGAIVLMIGDPDRQSLQQFAGARPALFDTMAAEFGCEYLELTVNRRCAKSIVEAAPFAGSMRALDTAPQGTVESLPDFQVIDEIMSGDHGNQALICETNAPLISLAVKLITNDTPVRMRVGKIDDLIKRYAFKHICNRDLPIGGMAEAMRTELAEAEGDGKDVSEFVDIIQVIEALETFALSKGIFKTVFRNRAPRHPVQQALDIICSGETGISLMTGHTSKGLEWHTVFHLPAKMKAPETEWQANQNNCLSHVIATRAKSRFVTLITE